MGDINAEIALVMHILHERYVVCFPILLKFHDYIVIQTFW